MDYIKYWCEHIESLVLNHGSFMAIAKLKAIRLHVTRFLSGSPLLTNEVNVRVDKEGIPSCLRLIKPLVKTQNPRELQFLMTLLILSRAIEGGHKEPDLNPIVRPSPNVDWELYREEIRSVLTEHKVRKRPQPTWEEFHPSTKKGPNGQAVLTSVNDAHALKEHPELLESILYLGSNPKLDTVIKHNQTISLEAWSKLSGTTSTQIRKLSMVHDPEAKTRIIAIFDYWSQAVLFPLHKDLMELLRELPGDRTFNQLKGFCGTPTANYWSIDLKDATDRFPLGFQKVVLSEIYNNQYSEHWVRVLTSKPFSNPWSEPAFYGAGQPMGAYSSWAAFTISHHVLIWIARKRSGGSLSDLYYQVLGDDVVISDDKTKDIYLSILDQFGVVVSKQKSHNSQYMYEFAKRWYWNGHEISGLPVRGILTVRNFWWHLLPELKEIYMRSSKPHDVMDPGVLSRFLRITGSPLRFAKRLYITHLLLASFDGCNLGRTILRSWVFLNVTRCNETESSYLKRLDDYIVTLQASFLEESIKATRLTQDKYKTEIAKAGLSMDLLSNSQDKVAVFALINQLYQEAKNRIQGLKEGAYSSTEITRMAENLLLVDPVTLLHERKKHLKAQAQVDLTKKILDLMRTEEHIRRRLLVCDDEEMSDLFRKWQAALPSWKREKVSWTHLAKSYRF